MTSLVRFWIAAAFVLAAGCNTSGLVGGQCAHGLSPCDQSCVNLGSSESNCGSCGFQCDSGEACRAGVCMPSDNTGEDTSRPGTDGTGTGSNQDGVDASLDSSVDLVDGGDSNGVDADALDGSVSSEPDSNFEDPCFPPFSSAENCGACGVVCTEQAPFCAPSGETFVCVDGCNDPLQLCADRCVNLVTDPLHCGECGNQCPTGLCRNSRCVGGQIGHLVAMCMSYEQLFSSSPQGVLLANAVFLATKETVRVMMFDAYAPGAARNQMRSVITSAGRTRGRTVRIDSAQTAEQIVSNLNLANYEALVIADTSLAPTNTARDLGRTISTTIDTFSRAGGIVVVASGAAAIEMPEFWNDNGASLFDIRGVADVTFLELQNRAPADALAANVLTPFLALTSTCVFDMPAVTDPDTEIVITGPNPGDAGGELPVVLHRVMYP